VEGVRSIAACTVRGVPGRGADRHGIASRHRRQRGVSKITLDGTDLDSVTSISFDGREKRVRFVFPK
jgi:hypothetical protein